MNRTLCVIAMLVAAQVVSAKAGASPARGDAPVMLQEPSPGRRTNPLSPGRLQFAPDSGGGEGDERPPLEPGRITLEALCGIPAFVIAAVPLVISQELVRPRHPAVAHYWTGATLAIVIPTLTAALQTLIGSMSSTTRVRFLPPWLAGLAIQFVVTVGLEVISVMGHITDDRVGRGLSLGFGVLTMFGTPIVQMLVMNSYRTARPLEEGRFAAITWPGRAAAEDDRSGRVVIRVAAVHF